jgi:site-specific DNA-methyltransferase (cytosine-N4-specific)
MSYRARTPAGLKPKDLIGIPWRLAFALQEAGWYLGSDIIWEKPNCMPESVKDRPTRSHEYVFLFSKSLKYHYNSSKAKESNGRNRRTVWSIPTEPFLEAHFATFASSWAFLKSSFMGNGMTSVLSNQWRSVEP